MALELQVYEKLKKGSGQIETPILNNLDQEMQTILNSQRPAHEKLQLYNVVLQKSEQLEKKTADVTPQAVEDGILSDFDRQMQAVLKSQKPTRKKYYYITISCGNPVYMKKSSALDVRGGAENTRLEAKDTKNISGQGQGHKKNPRPRPRTAFPRTEPLEAKNRNARGQGQGPRTQAQAFSKKKIFKNFFQAISNSLHTQSFRLGEA